MSREITIAANGSKDLIINVQQTIKKARRRLTTAAAIRRTGTAIAVSAGAGLVLLAVDRLATLNIAMPVYLAVLGKELDTLPCAEPVLGNELREGSTLNELHHKVGLAALARIMSADLVDLGDAGMLQTRQDLGFQLEPAQQAA